MGGERRKRSYSFSESSNVLNRNIFDYDILKPCPVHENEQLYYNLVCAIDQL